MEEDDPTTGDAFRKYSQSFFVFHQVTKEGLLWFQERHRHSTSSFFKFFNACKTHHETLHFRHDKRAPSCQRQSLLFRITHHRLSHHRSSTSRFLVGSEKTSCLSHCWLRQPLSSPRGSDFEGPAAPMRPHCGVQCSGRVGTGDHCAILRFFHDRGPFTTPPPSRPPPRPPTPSVPLKRGSSHGGMFRKEYPTRVNVRGNKKCPFGWGGVGGVGCRRGRGWSLCNVCAAQRRHCVKGSFCMICSIRNGAERLACLAGICITIPGIHDYFALTNDGRLGAKTRRLYWDI